ncbi:hypothetical protein HDU91_007191, partial [Kappamyces sp. JEL0680]
LDIPVHPDDISGLFDALSEPVSNSAASRTELKLSPDYLQKLRVVFENSSNDSSLKVSQTNAELVETLAKPTLQNITELIFVNSKTRRPAEAQKAFDAIKTLGLVPDLVAFNNLLDAYATSNDMDESMRVFQSIKAAGLQPDIVTYSTLIKVCVSQNDVDAAFKLYSEMKAKNLYPNVIVFTMLIQGCLKTKQHDRAWKVFNHMRSEVEKPDSKCYSLMIAACAQTSDAERALDIFQEMADYSIPSSTATYNNLIRACGLRKDYYLEAFSLLEQMVAAGFEPNLYTYRILFEIVAVNRDVVRGRLLWNDFAKRMDLQSLQDTSSVYEAPLRPDNQIFSQLLRLYHRVLSAGKPLSEEPAAPEHSPVDFVQLNLDLTHSGANGVPLLDSKDTSVAAIAQEGQSLWELAEKYCEMGLLSLDVDLWSRKLDLLCLDKSEAGIRNALAYFETAQTLGLEPEFKTYRGLLWQVLGSPHFKTHGKQVWDMFLEWDSQLEKRMSGASSGPLSLAEKEALRAKSKRTRRNMQDCFFSYAIAQSSNGDLDAALETLKESRDFREPYYLPPIELKKISRVVEEAKRRADSGDLGPLKLLQDLCPLLPQDPLAQVHAVLRRKTIPTKWWGWSAMGITKEEQAALLRKHEKANAKIHQREAASRNKASAHSANKLRRPVVFRGFVEDDLK